VEKNLIQKLTSDIARPATDPDDIAVMQEICTWLRSLPETERLRPWKWRCPPPSMRAAALDAYLLVGRLDVPRASRGLDTLGLTAPLVGRHRHRKA
jgi:hypothetical protein